MTTATCPAPGAGTSRAGDLDWTGAATWAQVAFPGVRDVRVRHVCAGGEVRQVLSGTFCGTALEFVPAGPDGAWRARAMGVCSAGDALVECQAARPRRQVSRACTVFAPVPLLAGEVDFFRVYGEWPTDTTTGPVPAVAQLCRVCPLLG